MDHIVTFATRYSKRIWMDGLSTNMENPILRQQNKIMSNTYKK